MVHHLETAASNLLVSLLVSCSCPPAPQESSRTILSCHRSPVPVLFWPLYLTARTTGCFRSCEPTACQLHPTCKQQGTLARFAFPTHQAANPESSTHNPSTLCPCPESSSAHLHNASGHWIQCIFHYTGQRCTEAGL